MHTNKYIYYSYLGRAKKQEITETHCPFPLNPAAHKDKSKMKQKIVAICFFIGKQKIMAKVALIWFKDVKMQWSNKDKCMKMKIPKRLRGTIVLKTFESQHCPCRTVPRQGYKSGKIYRVYG